VERILRSEAPETWVGKVKARGRRRTSCHYHAVVWSFILLRKEGKVVQKQKFCQKEIEDSSKGRRHCAGEIKDVRGVGGGSLLGRRKESVT